jgi:hypothetical protein
LDSFTAAAKEFLYFSQATQDPGYDEALQHESLAGDVVDGSGGKSH